MLNSHQRCSNSSIFCINAKTCTTRNLDEVLQARQYQRMIIKSSGWSFYVHPLHRTLSEVAAKPRVKLRTTRSAGRWTPLQYKIEDNRQKYAGREKLSIKISDTERYCRRYQEEGHSCAEDRKCLRGFRYDVQASCRHQAHCLRRRRVWATGGK